MVEAGRFEYDLLRAPHDRFGARARCPFREIDETQQISLVLRRNESGRHANKGEDRECNENEVYADHGHTVLRDAGHQLNVTLLQPKKSFVELHKQIGLSTAQTVSK